MPLKGHAYGKIGVALLPLPPPPPVLPRQHASTTLTQPSQLKPVRDTTTTTTTAKGSAEKKVDEKVTWGRALCAAREVQSKGKQQKGTEREEGRRGTAREGGVW